MATGDTSAGHRPRRRWFVIGLAVASVVIVVSVVLSPAFARGGSESFVGRADTSVAGARAPTFDLPRLEGGRLRLDQFEGSVVVVNFWASWCIPCREEVGTLESLARKSRGRGVRLVGVVENDTAGAARRFQRVNMVSWPSANDADRRTAVNFGVRGVPETYVIDRNGRLAAKVLGRLRDGQLDDVIESLLQKRPTKPSASQSGQ